MYTIDLYINWDSIQKQGVNFISYMDIRCSLESFSDIIVSIELICKFTGYLFRHNEININFRYSLTFDRE